MHTIEVFVFSFNRGKFLKNCVDSAVRYIPNAKVNVIDDNSKDKETLQILDQLSQSVTVLKPKSSDNKRWGGFYENINWVFHDLANNPWVIFIEDDMQFIRPFLNSDFDNINNFFKKYSNAACLSIDFFKEEHRELNNRNVEINNTDKIYFLKNTAKTYRGTIHFNNPTIFNIKRIREIGFEYRNCRIENRNNFEQSFDRMGFYAFPLLMYLPSPPSTKNKIKTHTRHLVERYYRTGFYPYQEMTQEELEQFLNRDISILPYTSDWLKTTAPLPEPPFEYKDAMKRCHGVFRLIEIVEKYIRGIKVNK
ncbi:MAG TPA: glycosyltransferase [Ignavibacteria bacterium]|nr:glycosyltransferase [Ignavibacteria bacterium]